MEAPIVTSPKLNAKKFLITYSRTEDNADFLGPSLADFLYSKPHTVYVRVNREYHADGGEHWHAIISFSRRYQGVVASCFDFLGQHPNIRVIRSRKHEFNCLEYVVKDGDDYKVDRGVIPDPDDPPEAKCNPWREALENSSSVTEFMAAIEFSAPKEFVLRHFDLLAFANHRFNAPSSYVPEFQRDSFTVPEAADEWVANVLREVRTAWPRSFSFFV